MKGALNLNEAGLYAASGRGMQATVLVAVAEKALRDRIAEANRKIGGWPEGFDPFYGAPAMILVLADIARPTFLYDGSLVMGNLMLAAHALGLGSCWIHRAREEFESGGFGDLLQSLGIGEGYEGIGHCALGYAAEPFPPPPPRKPGRVFYRL